MSTTRINELPAAAGVASNDYLAIDNTSGVSQKATAAQIVNVDNTLSVAGRPADAKATGDAISEEAVAREQAVSEEAAAREAVGAEIDDLKGAIISIATPYLINDTYLSAQGITDVRSLPVDRAFIFQNVTVSNIANMPPVVDATTTGILLSYRGYTDKRYGTSYIYMTSQGLIYTGVDVNTGNIRWKNYAEKSAVDGLTSSVTTLIADAFRTFSVTLTDSWLSDNGVTNARQLQKNRVYIFSNVTKTNFSSMPDLPDTVYNGALLYFKQNVNAFSPLLYINNFGECWTGIDTGSEIRWRKTSTESLDDSLSGFHNKKVLILGDSIVYGSHMTDYSPGSRTVITLSDGTSYKNNLSTTVWSAKFMDYIVQNYGVTVVNNAWPGARYQDLVTYYDQIVTDTFDYVIICMGVNNWNSGTSVLTSLRSLKSSFYATATKMIVMTPLGSTTYASQLGVIRDFIKTWGKENSIEIGDLYSTFNFLNYIQGHTLSEVLLDGVHYNDSAQTAICEAVKKTLHL